MVRFALWVPALVMGSLAARGLVSFAPPSGGGILIAVGSLFVLAFVTSCVITAGESLIPALRTVTRPATRSARRP